jgi:hypothetical protein
MQDPEPSKPPTSWVPSQSIVGGNSIGATIAILVVPFIIPLYPKGIDHDSITLAFGALCTFIASYLIPDGKPRS